MSETEAYRELIFGILAEFYRAEDAVLLAIDEENRGGPDCTLRTTQIRGGALERIWELIEDSGLGLIDAYDEQTRTDS